MIDENGRNNCYWKEDKVDEEFYCNVFLNELGEIEKQVSNRAKNHGKYFIKT
jgi:hypothetical protein